jgi:hypothetical protein
MGNNLKTLYIILGKSNAIGLYESIQGVYDSESDAKKEIKRLNQTPLGHYENFEIESIELNVNSPIDISSGF